MTRFIGFAKHAEKPPVEGFSVVKEGDSMNAHLKELEEKIAYEFHDKHLFAQALRNAKANKAYEAKLSGK